MQLETYRQPEAIEQVLAEIQKITTKRWKIMEICGGQTHAIMKYGLDQLLPIEMLHGPGCPVCVTPTDVLDQAIDLAQRPDVIFGTFADMLRVPGTHTDLLATKASGADVRSLYSPLDAVGIAEENPDKEVVFFAVGFETTAPANALALYTAHQKGILNFSLLVSQVLVPPAIEALLTNPNHQIDGFLAAGHVCTVMGYESYEPLSHEYKVPIVVTGFEPLDIVQGIYLCVRQLEEGRHQVENQYVRSVYREGNPSARSMLEKVFAVNHKDWRGLGEIRESGLTVHPNYSKYDASLKFNLSPKNRDTCNGCISGEILQGLKKPNDCPQFGSACTPEHPLGATMVSNEGACSAYFLYKGEEL